MSAAIQSPDSNQLDANFTKQHEWLPHEDNAAIRESLLIKGREDYTVWAHVTQCKTYNCNINLVKR